MNESAAAALRTARELGRQGRLAEAIDAYLRVLGTAPELADAWYNLARLQRRNRQFNEALGSYQQALDRGATRPEEIHLNRGVIYADDLRQERAAERELERALELNPRYVPALLNLANLCEDEGRREAALALYERALAQDSESFEAIARSANLRVFNDPADPWIGRLRQALDNPRAGDSDRASLFFALGRALDACGRYAAAFEAYRSANRHSRRSAAPGTGDYDPIAAERAVERLLAAFASPAPETATPAAAAARAVPAPTPIFVCGMFRSGSTLTEQILAGHPRVVAGGELDLLPRMVQRELTPFPQSVPGLSSDRRAELAAQYRQRLAEVFQGAEFVTDKRPDNFWLIGLIKSLFPAAKIVHTTRDPLDNCLSIFFLHLDQSMSYALDLKHIGHHFRQYRRLMAHWKSLYGQDIVDLDYDALVKDPDGVSRRLIQEVGLEWDDRCLAVAGTDRSIKTASVWQVREPIYRRSSGRARHYERELADLRSYLGEP